jgi:hypothetical protein
MSEQLNEAITKKWKPILDHADMPKIADAHRRATTATLLENQEIACRQQYLAEAGSTNVMGAGGSPSLSQGGNIQGFDPILIQLIRRAMPNLMAYDICGVQAMTAPTGLIFAMRTKYANSSNVIAGPEAFYNEPNSIFSGGRDNTTVGTTQGVATSTDPFAGYPGLNVATAGLTIGVGLNTSNGEGLTPNEMGFSVERVAVEAKTRSLAASYSIELAQDLKAVHGLDAESELSNILSTEVLAEINREVVKTVYTQAVLGCQQPDLFYMTGGSTAAGVGLSLAGAPSGGIYDLIQDSDGRWSAEKFRGLMFQIERECNVIAKQTRRGKGNIVICSADVASALAMGGFLNLSPALNVSLDVDDTGNTFVGTLNGKLKVYIDPYATETVNFCCVGYKGTSPYDAGIFYCPYVPLQMMRAIDPLTFQPKIAFKTRYGMVANPYSQGLTVGSGALTARTNKYYRMFRIDNLHGVAS